MDESKQAARSPRIRPRLIVLAAVLALAGAAGWWAWQNSHPPESSGAAAGAASGAGNNARRFGGVNRVQPVTVAIVRRQDMRVVHAAIGNIAALNTAVVRARVEGELKAI